MRHFKKKTIVLCLASMLAVMGSCNAETYKNSLMSIKINSGSGGAVSLTAFTSKNYTQMIKTEPLENGAFSIILPETYSQMTQMPDLTGYQNIESMQVSTYPYTVENKGYTKIYIKTKGNPTISTNTSLYIPDNQMTDIPNNISSSISSSSSSDNVPPKNIKRVEPVSYWDMHKSNKPQDNQETKLENNNSRNNSVSKNKQISKKNVQTETEPVNYNNTNELSDNSSWERISIVLGILFITFLLFFVYFVSKEKMASLVGESSDFVDDEEDKKKKTKKSIKSTIKALDKTYTNKTFSKPAETIEKPFGDKEDINKNNDDVNESANIVDLDSLFNEAKNVQNQNSEEIENTVDQEENDDLADFLNEFSFEDNENPEQKTELKEDITPSFNEELYNQIISSDFSFDKSDISKIEQLMQNELKDEIIENPELFISNPITTTKNEIFENIIAEYTIKQDISFSKDDVDALKKIMNVELDPDFITDLRTKPQRTQQMLKEISQQKDIRKALQQKTSEAKILNVKEFLPDLSEELKKQNNKNFESNAKSQVVYYSEGYEVSKLSVDSELSDISAALQRKDATEPRPSDPIVKVLDGYDVPTLHIDLNDLQEDKNDEQKENQPNIPDENALLKSLANITFKPFYEEEAEEQNKIQNEERNGELIQNMEQETVQESSKTNLPKTEVKDAKNNNIELIELTRQQPKKTVRANKDAQQLLLLIEEQNAKRKTKNIEYTAEKKAKKTEAERKQKALNDSKELIDIIENNKPVDAKEKPVKESENNNECNINGIHYDIIKYAQCDSNITCALAKSGNNYLVIGMHKGLTKILKQYDNLKKETIAIRLNEKLTNGTTQYLVKLCSYKFIINVFENDMEFVMDLC